MSKKAPQKKGIQIDYTEFEKKAIENEDRETLLQFIEEYSAQNKIYKEQLYELTEQARQQAIDDKEVGQKIQYKAEIKTKEHELLEDQLTEMVSQYQEKLQKLVFQQKEDLEQNERQYQLDVKQKDNEISDSTQKMQNYVEQMKKQEQLEDKIRELKEEKIKEAHAHSDEISKMQVQKQAEELDALNKNLKSQLEVSKKVLTSEKTKQSSNLQEKKLFGRQVQLNEDFAQEYQEVNLKNLKNIKALKEQVEYLKDFISREVSKYAKEIEYSKYENETKKKEFEEQIAAMKDYFQQKSEEYKSIKNLSRVILDQKSWVEAFFVESLDKVRQELRKNQQDKSKQKLPAIGNTSQQQPLDNNTSVRSKLDKEKVDIAELEPEEKEKIMRILYYKITQGAQPLPWFDLEEQQELEQNSLIQQQQSQESMQQQLESQNQSKVDSFH